MSSLPILYNSMMAISIPRKAAAHRLAKINNRSVRILAHSTPRLVFQHSAASTSVKDVRPPITPFTPSMWGDTFSTFSFDQQLQQKYSEEIEALKKEARSILMAATSTKLLTLIDTLARLGIEYHFETEIEEKLKQVYDSAEKEEEDYDLCATALRFRLLRQHQYHVSCDAFVKFVDKRNNKLKESLSSDVEGLLSLYEAAHVRIHDENVLEEAVAFTTHHLSRMQPQLESSHREKLQHALKYPLHKSPAVLSFRFHIDIYENDDSRDEIVLRLAKLNFNFMQNIYRKELYEVTTWWNKFDLKSKLPYFRDRLVENYMWAMAYHFEPHYSLVRMMITKYYMVMTVVDDTYDNYATLAEMELLTRALERLNMDEIDVLPHDYLKSVCKCVKNFSEEFEGEAEKQGKAYAVAYYIDGMKRAGRGYGQEQKWIMEKHVPSFQEYLIHSRNTGLMYVSLIVAVAVIKSSTKETMDWVLSDPQILLYASDTARLLDDLATYQRESKGGTLLTSLDYYMKDTGESMQDAQFAFKDQIEEKWKHLTAAWVNCSMVAVPKEIVVQILDLARMCGTFYMNEEDAFTYPEKSQLAPLIVTLLLDPIPI